MAQPPRIPDTGPTKEEVESVIEEATGGEDFGTDFMSDMLLFFNEEADFLFSGQTTYFILGNYGPYPIRQLQLVESQLNKRVNCYAFLLCDLLDADEIRATNEKLHPEAGAEDAKNSTIDSPTPFGDHTPEDRCKFCLLAAWSKYLVLVFEGRHVGPSIELEFIESQYSDRAHLFPRDYDVVDIDEIRSDIGIDTKDMETIDNQAAYSNTQLDLFSIYHRRGRLCSWTSRGNLAVQAAGLP